MCTQREVLFGLIFSLVLYNFKTISKIIIYSIVIGVLSIMVKIAWDTYNTDILPTTVVFDLAMKAYPDASQFFYKVMNATSQKFSRE
jgi:hypothetical protein